MGGGGGECKGMELPTSILILLLGAVNEYLASHLQQTRCLLSKLNIQQSQSSLTSWSHRENPAVRGEV